MKLVSYQPPHKFALPVPPLLLRCAIIVIGTLAVAIVFAEATKCWR